MALPAKTISDKEIQALHYAVHSSDGVIQEAVETISAAFMKGSKAWCFIASEIYKFALAHDPDAIKAKLDEMELPVKGKNPWTPAAKLAWAYLDNGKWTVSDQQVNKYANVCKALDQEGKTAKDCLEYLEQETLTALNKKVHSLAGPISPTPQPDDNKESKIERGKKLLVEKHADEIIIEEHGDEVIVRLDPAKFPAGKMITSTVIIGEDGTLEAIIPAMTKNKDTNKDEFVYAETVAVKAGTIPKANTKPSSRLQRVLSSASFHGNSASYVLSRQDSRFLLTATQINTLNTMISEIKFAYDDNPLADFKAVLTPTAFKHLSKTASWMAGGEVAVETIDGKQYLTFAGDEPVANKKKQMLADEIKRHEERTKAINKTRTDKEKKQKSETDAHNKKIELINAVFDNVQDGKVCFLLEESTDQKIATKKPTTTTASFSLTKDQALEIVAELGSRRAPEKNKKTGSRYYTGEQTFVIKDGQLLIAVSETNAVAVGGITADNLPEEAWTLNVEELESVLEAAVKKSDIQIKLHPQGWYVTAADKTSSLETLLPTSEGRRFNSSVVELV